MPSKSAERGMQQEKKLLYSFFCWRSGEKRKIEQTEPIVQDCKIDP